jgi:hypothetical protein
MHEALVVPQVVAELREAVERYEMPEMAATLALEESLTHRSRDSAIRRSVIRNL